MTGKGLGLRNLAHNIGATFVRQILAALLGLITTMVIARVYGPSGNGTFVVALLLPSILATFLNLGVASANVYYLGSKQTNARQLFNANLRIFAVVGALGLLIGAIALAWKAEQFFPGVDPFILWFALATFPVSLLNNYLHSLFQGLQAFHRYNILAIIQPSVLLLLVGLITVLGNRGITLLVCAQMFAQIVVLALGIYWLMPLLGKKDLPLSYKPLIHKTIGYGWKAHLSNIIAFANYKADVFLVNLFLGPTSVGIYVISVALVERLWLFSQAVSTVLLPRLAELSSDENTRRQLTPLIARWVLLITLLFSFVLAVVASPLITGLFGAGYDEALLPLWILLPGIVATSTSRVLANDIAARGRPELNMYTSVVVVAVNIIGNIILIPLYGLLGAAAATTIAYVLNLLLRLVIYCRFTGTRWFNSLIVKPSDFRMLILMLRSS